MQLIRALLPLVVAADPAERGAVVQELKARQRGYLEPIFGGQRLNKELAPRLLGRHSNRTARDQAHSTQR